MSTNYAASELERGKGIGFERIRRITGYLVGTLDRFNSAKASEEHDRVKHDLNKPVITKFTVDTQERIRAAV